MFRVRSSLAQDFEQTLFRPLSAEQIAHARQLISEDKKPAEVARLLGVHRATLYRALENAIA